MTPNRDPSHRVDHGRGLHGEEHLGDGDLLVGLPGPGVDDPIADVGLTVQEGRRGGLGSQ